jgi:hypothetical protein
MERELYNHLSDALSALDQGIVSAQNADRPFIANLLEDAFDLVDKAEKRF